MTGDWSEILRTAFGIAAIVAAGIAGTFYSTLRTLRQTIKDRDARIEGLEDTIADRDKTVTEVKAGLQVAQTDLDALKRVVTGETHWAAIEDQLTQLSDDVRELLRRVT